MKVIATKKVDMEAENGWFILADAPVAILAIHEVVATAACSTDPCPFFIKDIKLHNKQNPKINIFFHFMS